MFAVKSDQSFISASLTQYSFLATGQVFPDNTTPKSFLDVHFYFYLFIYLFIFFFFFLVWGCGVGAGAIALKKTNTAFSRNRYRIFPAIRRGFCPSTKTSNN